MTTEDRVQGEGERAANGGSPASACPYQEHDPAFQWWMRGWHRIYRLRATYTPPGLIRGIQTAMLNLDHCERR